MVFMGRGFTSREQESGSGFSAAVCTIQATKCYLPLVPKDKGERSATQLRCLLIMHLPKVGHLRWRGTVLCVRRARSNKLRYRNS